MRRFAKPLGVAATLVAVLLGAWALVPRLVRSEAQAWVAANLPGKALALGEIGFNPLTLTLTLADLAIGDAATPEAPMVKVAALDLDLSLAGLVTLSPRFDAIRIERPEVAAVLRRDASLNLAELLPADDGAPLPRVVIGRLDIVDGRARLTDERPLNAGRPAHVSRLIPVRLALSDFSTGQGDAPGRFHLEGRSGRGEGFSFDGSLGLAPVRSEGRLVLSAVELETLAQLAGELLPVRAASGRLGLSGRYALALPDTPALPVTLRVDLSALELADVAVATNAGDRLALARARLGATRTDGVTLLAGSLEATGLRLGLAGGEVLALDELQVAPSRLGLKAGTGAVGAVALAGLGLGDGKTMPVRLARLGLAAADYDLRARRLALGRLTLDGLGVDARLGEDLQPAVPGLWPRKPGSAAAGSSAADWTVRLDGLALAGLDAGVTYGGTTHRIAGDVTLGAYEAGAAVPVTAALQLDGAALALNGSAEPGRGAADMGVRLDGLNLAKLAGLLPRLPVALAAGRLSLEGRVRAGRGEPDFRGRVVLAGLDLRQLQADGGAMPFLALARLEASGLEAQPSRVNLRRLAVTGLEGQARLGADGRLNLVALVDEDAPLVAADGTPPLVRPASRAKAAMPLVHIDEVVVAGASLGFEDLAVRPNFAVRVEALSGRITNVDSRPGRLASVDLKGQVVDRFSPVEIRGTGNVFDYADATDITASFRNIELPVFNPYSGRFAGYAIARGKLTTTLHYRIDKRKLAADHAVQIDQLAWGEATDSQEKVGLPIRLAASLLKDRDGVIRLDLPVAGTVDDPSFRIWPIVWKILGNVLTKLVTAPFAAIGSLFGGGSEKAQFIAFAPGSAELEPDAAGALAALGRGLAKREELNLDLPAGPGLREDADAMACAKLHAAAAAAEKRADWASMDEEQRLEALRTVWKARRRKGPAFPDDMKEKAARLAWLESELLADFAPSDLELASLGQARANAVKAALLADDALDPGRVFLTTASAAVLRDSRPTLELKLK